MFQFHSWGQRPCFGYVTQSSIHHLLAHPVYVSRRQAWWRDGVRLAAFGPVSLGFLYMSILVITCIHQKKPRVWPQSFSSVTLSHFLKENDLKKKKQLTPGVRRWCRGGCGNRKSPSCEPHCRCCPCPSFWECPGSSAPPGPGGEIWSDWGGAGRMRNGDRRHGVISCCSSSPFPQLLPLTLARQKALNSPYLAFPFIPPWNQIGKKEEKIRGRGRVGKGWHYGEARIMQSLLYSLCYIHPTSSCSWWFSRPPTHCFCDPSTWPPVQMTLSQSSPEPRSGRQCGHAVPTEARQRVRSRAIDSEVPWH